MNYKVWKVTDENFVEIAQFAEEGDAYSFSALMRMLGDDRYEVTKMNETPVW